MFYNSLKPKRCKGRNKMIKKYLSETRYIKLLFVFITVCPYTIREHSVTFLTPSVKDFGKYEYNITVFSVYNFSVNHSSFVRQNWIVFAHPYRIYN